MKRLLCTTAVVLALAAAAGPSRAAPLTAANDITGTGADVTATYLGSSAGDLDMLSLLTNPGSLTLFFNQGLTSIGTTIDLGAFAIGEAIEFALTNLTTGTTFTEGAGSGNPDGDIHMLVTPDLAAITALCNGSGCLSAASLAAAAALPAGTIFVGVEDLAAYQGSDFDYNDLVFAVDGAIDPTAVPEPSSMALVLSGLACAGLLGRTRARRAFDAELYKLRNIVERAICRLKDWRRIATRYDKLGSGPINLLIC